MTRRFVLALLLAIITAHYNDGCSSVNISPPVDLLLPPECTLSLTPAPISSHFTATATHTAPEILTLLTITTPVAGYPLTLQTLPTLGYRLLFHTAYSTKLYNPGATLLISLKDDLLTLTAVAESGPKELLKVPFPHSRGTRVAVPRVAVHSTSAVFHGFDTVRLANYTPSLYQLHVPEKRTSPPTLEPIVSVGFEAEGAVQPLSKITLLYPSTLPIGDAYLNLYIRSLKTHLPAASVVLVRDDEATHYPPPPCLLIVNHHVHDCSGGSDTILRTYADRYAEIHDVKPGLIHLNHELTRSSRDDSGGVLDVYAGEKYGTIWRNYYWASAFGRTEGTRYLPLGPANSAWEYTGGLESKDFQCTFVGNLRNGNRADLTKMEDFCEVIDAVNLVGTGAVYGKYEEVIAGSVFCLCPGGNNFETFRFWESVMQGCVPVVVREPGFGEFKEGVEMWWVGEIEEVVVLCEEWGEECGLRMNRVDLEKKRRTGERFVRLVGENVKSALERDIAHMLTNHR